VEIQEINLLSRKVLLDTHPPSPTGELEEEKEVSPLNPMHLLTLKGWSTLNNTPKNRLNFWKN